MAGSISSGSISFERCDSYEDQLKSLFISFCDRQKEELDENGLVRLCQELELSESSQERLVRRLLQSAPNGTVSFEVFKEALVVLLEQLHPVKPEVEPKLVVRNKKYGRKSRPSSVDLSDGELEESAQAPSVRMMIKMTMLEVLKEIDLLFFTSIARNRPSRYSDSLKSHHTVAQNQAWATQFSTYTHMCYVSE